MFEFRIIDTPDGNQVIRRDLKTPYNALTPIQMIEYMEVDVQLTISDRLKKKAQAESNRMRNFARNPLWKLACFCGLV